VLEVYEVIPHALDSVPKCREQTVEDSGLLECHYVLLGVSGTYVFVVGSQSTRRPLDPERRRQYSPQKHGQSFAQQCSVTPQKCGIINLKTCVYKEF